jgi:alkanesulfonate monooxygenase SsuD/methylene tetrahydromethanopterin reductase-like flavin-dependent oxidoreductase (luciferase family)
MPFAERGAILEEQIDVLRQLWTQESVTVDGKFHHITAAGLAPLPIQRPIPIWIGAFSPGALRRVGRLADGWFPMNRPGGSLTDALEIIAGAALEVGRDPSTIAFEGRVNYTPDDPDLMFSHAERWREAGASHISLNTMGAGLDGVEDHINAISTFAAQLI